MNFEDIINDFWRYVKQNEIELYNEFSLQHELGIFLRNKLPNYIIQFERNTSFFGLKNIPTIKKEIDVVIYIPNMTEKYAIEIKYPRNGQYPEQMYSFVKDIVFMEQLKKNGFNGTYVLTVVDDKNFYSGKCSQENIYSYFRGNKNITGKICKPTGTNKNVEYVEVVSNYEIKWKTNCLGQYYYMLII